jgi:hypothetical protein
MKKLFALIILAAASLQAHAQCSVSFTDSVFGLTSYFYNTSISPVFDSFMFAKGYLAFGDGDTAVISASKGRHAAYVTFGIASHIYPNIDTYTAKMFITFTDTSGIVLCSDSSTLPIITVAGGHSYYSGQIFRDSLADTSLPFSMPNDTVKVYLVSYNPSSYAITAVDSTLTSGPGKFLGYQFSGITPGYYLIKAASLHPNVFTPTYYPFALHWNSAYSFYAPSGSGMYDTTTAHHWHYLNMQYGSSVYTGPGFIAGDVRYGAGKGTAYGDPYKGMTIYLNDNTSGKLIATTTTDDSGKYSFNVPYGTYTVYPEVPGLVATPWNNITVSSSASAQPKINFVATSKAITPGTLSVASNTGVASTPFIYPNPASGSINIQWNGFAKNAQAHISISDVLGKTVLSQAFIISSAATNLDISSLQPGVYFVATESAGNNYHQKLIIK